MKLIVDINDNDYGLINNTGITLDMNTVLHGKEKDKELTFATFNLVKALKNGTPYEERPQGEWVFKFDNPLIPTGYWECSECKIGRLLVESKFCPDCGADMRGERMMTIEEAITRLFVLR